MTTTFDAEARYAQLNERVENQGQRIVHLETTVTRGFSEVGSQLKGLSDEIRGNSKTQWPVIWSAIGVSITFVGMIGALAYFPIREATTDLKSAVTTLSDRMVTRQEVDWRAARAAEDRARLDDTIHDIRSNLVPRVELEDRLSDVRRDIDRIEKAKTP